MPQGKAIDAMDGAITWTMVGLAGALLTVAAYFYAQMNGVHDRINRVKDDFDDKIEAHRREADAEIERVRAAAAAEIEKVRTAADAEIRRQDKAFADYKLEIATRNATIEQLRDVHLAVNQPITALTGEVRSLAQAITKDISDLIGAFKGVAEAIKRDGNGHSAPAKRKPAR